jgi:hypothetical protein
MMRENSPVSWWRVAGTTVVAIIVALWFYVIAHFVVKFW